MRWATVITEPSGPVVVAKRALLLVLVDLLLMAPLRHTTGTGAVVTSAVLPIENTIWLTDQVRNPTGHAAI